VFYQKRWKDYLNKMKQLFLKIRESLFSILPVFIIVGVIFGLQYSPVFPNDLISVETFLIFIGCVVAISLGMSLFSLGSETAMTKVGNIIGSSITKRRSIILMVIIAFLLGIMITIAEPDLTVLSSLVENNGLIDGFVFKLVIGVGVGSFFAVGLVRIVLQKPLKLWIVFFYLIVFALACLFGANGNRIFEISFDASGVTTGPVAVPFLLTFGAGVATVRGGKNSSSDSFGLTGLCSIGPIIASMILFLPLQNSPVFESITNPIDVTPSLGPVILHTMLEVLIAIGPIIAFFIIYNFIFTRIRAKEMLKILFGFVIVYVGLVIFLSAANFGLIPLGYRLGRGILDAGPDYYYLAVVLGITIGLVIVFAEPSVQILVNQVEEVSGRAISKLSVTISLAIGVASAIGLSVIRIVYGNNFNFMYAYVPLCGVALLLCLIVSDTYAAIAFDSGGVASGAMASCFVLPFIIGIGDSSNTVSTVSGFGVIGYIAVMPIITIQLLGLFADIKKKVVYARARKSLLLPNDDQIISF